MRLGRRLHSVQPRPQSGSRSAMSRISRQIKPEIVANGNTCRVVQIAAKAALPVVHTVQLLDRATGGPVPAETRF